MGASNEQEARKMMRMDHDLYYCGSRPTDFVLLLPVDDEPQIRRFDPRSTSRYCCCCCRSHEIRTFNSQEMDRTDFIELQIWKSLEPPANNIRIEYRVNRKTTMQRLKRSFCNIIGIDPTKAVCRRIGLSLVVEDTMTPASLGLTDGVLFVCRLDTPGHSK
jgi:hypothetical protein